MVWIKKKAHIRFWFMTWAAAHLMYLFWSLEMESLKCLPQTEILIWAEMISTML